MRQATSEHIGPGFPDRLPRLGRMTQDEAEARRWAFDARKLWGVPVRVFERSLAAGGLNIRIWVAVIWPKGSKGA